MARSVLSASVVLNRTCFSQSGARSRSFFFGTWVLVCVPAVALIADAFCLFHRGWTGVLNEVYVVFFNNHD